MVSAAGLLAPLSQAGEQVLLPQIVKDPQSLMRANGLMETQWQLTTLFGPAMAGVLVAQIGPVSVLLLDAASFWLCAWCFGRIPLERQEQAEASHSLQSLAAELITGYLYLLKRPLLLFLMVFTFLFNMAYGPVEVGLPLFADQVLRGGSVALGMLWTALAAGSLLGSLLFSLLTWRGATGTALAAIMIGWGVATLPLGFSANLYLAMLSLGIAGLCYAPYGILYRTYLQKEVPTEMLGRVFTSFRTVTGLGMPLGAYAAGWLMPPFAVTELFFWSAVLCILIGWAAIVPLRRII